MIKLNEIRIGSIIRYAVTKKPVCVECINAAAEYISGSVPESRTVIGGAPTFFDPIPLEPAMMNAAGLGAGGFVTKDDREICSRLRTTEPDVYGIFVEGTRVAKVRFVHELQNVFFAVTGEECKIKIQ